MNGHDFTLARNPGNLTSARKLERLEFDVSLHRRPSIPESASPLGRPYGESSYPPRHLQ
jgi:hypothetical protein